MTREQMISEILAACKAGNMHIDGDLFFSLAFRTEKELRNICHELHISTK